MGIIFVVAGLLGVVLGIFGKEFYVGDPDAMTGFDRKSSRRSGRLVFIIAGLMLLAFGMKFLFSDN